MSGNSLIDSILGNTDFNMTTAGGTSFDISSGAASVPPANVTTPTTVINQPITKISPLILVAGAVIIFMVMSKKRGS
jgi:hypothetical protein